MASVSRGETGDDAGLDVREVGDQSYEILQHPVQITVYSTTPHL